MKRLLTAVMLLALTMGFSVAAQADPMTDWPGGVKGTITGKEVIIDQDGVLQTGADALRTPGLEMYGVFSISQVQDLAPVSSDGEAGKTIYASGRPGSGAYFAVLEGLSIAEYSWDVESFTGTMLFDGGAVTMYYLEDAYGVDIIDAVAAMQYVDGDFVAGEYSLNALKTAATVVFEANFAMGASAGLSIKEGALNAAFWTFADVAEGYEAWDNNAFGNGGAHDFELNVLLRPIDNNPGYLTVKDGSFMGGRPTPTPEPGTFILMSLGLLLTAGFARRQQM